MRKRTRLPAALAASVCVAGCQSAQTTAAHKIADALPRALGPADHYDVHVEGSTLALARGRADRIRVSGRQVRVAPGATLDTLDVDAHGISFDPAAKRLKHVDMATFTGTVGQQNLDQYLAARRSRVPGLTVRLRASDVLADVPLSLAGLHTRASLAGTLAPDAALPDHLDFIADSGSIAGLDVPGRLVNGALDLVNPIFDLSRRKVPLTITKVNVVNSQIVLQGSADLGNFQAP